MIVTKVETVPVRVPLVQPARWSGGTRETAPAVLVFLHTDEGLVGVGECNGPTLPTLRTVIESELAQFVVGQDPRRVEWILRRIEEYTRNWRQIGNYAMAALEMALLDLKGKLTGLPVVDLLGGVCQQRVPFIGYLFIGEPEETANQALAYVQQGFTTLKLKVGRSLRQDLETLAAIRDKVGYGVKIRVDANMAWSVPAAIKAIRAMQRYELEYVEQPVPDFDLEGMAQVRRAVEVPIAADEACTDLESVVRLIRADACDVFVVYISEAGGLTRARQIAALAEAVGKWCTIGSWAELGVGTLAAVHLASSSTAFAMAQDTHYPLESGDVLHERLAFQQGCLAVPDAPGLGAQLDPAKVEAYARVQAREAVFYDDVQGEAPRISRIDY